MGDGPNLDLKVNLGHEGSYQGAVQEAKELQKALDGAAASAQKVASPPGGGSNAAEGLRRLREAGYPVPGEAAPEAKIAHLTGDEIPQLQKLITQLEKVITVKRVLGQDYEKEAAAVAKAQAALKPYNDELARRAKLALELKANVQEEGAESEKAATKHNTLKEALKGLSLEFPALAQVARAAVSPIGLVATAATLLVGKARDYINEVEELSDRAEAIAHISEQVTPMSVLREGVEESRDALVRSYADIARSVNSLNAHYNELNATMLLQQQLAQKLSDAELGGKLANIDARLGTGQITQRQANEERAAAQREAQKRQADREIETVDQQKAFEQGRSLAAEIQKRSTERQLRDAEDATTAQKQQLQKAEKLAEITEGAVDKDVPKLRKDLAAVERVMRRENGVLSVQNIADAGRQISRGLPATPETAAKLQEQINAALTDAKIAADAVSKEKRRLKDLVAEETSLTAQANELERTRVEAARRAEQLEREAALRRENRQQIDAVNATADQDRRRAADAGEAKAQQLRNLQTQIERLNQADAQLPEGDPRRLSNKASRAGLQNQIDALNARPEDRQLIEEKNRTRTLETQEDINRKSQQDFQRDNRLGDAGRALDPIGEAVGAFASGIERSAAAQVNIVLGASRRIDALATRLEDLEGKFKASRA